MSEELKQIKKIYGEDMAHLCRELFPTILESEGTLLKILQEHLAPTRSFASDIKENSLYDEFKSWIYSFYNVEEKKEIVTGKTPFELMDEAGYTLYECHSEEEIQSFRKYYVDNEVLCTIYMGGRLNRCHVFFAVKKNVDEIKRENFDNPRREDEYGTSVISIQFSKSSLNTVSIKNRYNHTVNNPDATFHNNLENIIPGLTKSFEMNYGYHINQKTKNEEEFMTSDLCYVRANTGKYYRYNHEINGVYYCENNIIILDGRVLKKYANNKERYIVFENYILDRKTKQFIGIFGDSNGLPNDSLSFINSIYDVGTIKSIDVVKKDENRIIIFKYDDEKEDKKVLVEIDKHNTIVRYENNYVREIGDFFMPYNLNLREISLNNVETIGNSFLPRNSVLEKISIDKVKKIYRAFLRFNKALRTISLPELEDMGDYFLNINKILENIYVPKLKIIGSNVLERNQGLKGISLPEVINIDDYFLYHNTCEEFKIEMPKVKIIWYRVLSNIVGISGGELYLPEVEEICEEFLSCVNNLQVIKLPKVKNIRDAFAVKASQVSVFDAPNLESIGDCCLRFNENITDLSLTKVEYIGYGFLEHNKSLKSIYVPSLFQISNAILNDNTAMKEELEAQLENNRRQVLEIVNNKK